MNIQSVNIFCLSWRVNYFWFRRDLRLNDNVGLHAALQAGEVQPVFIFDTNILDGLRTDDPRVSFIHSRLQELNMQLSKYDSALHTYYGDPLEIWRGLLSDNDIQAVYYNRDYEPYARSREKVLKSFFSAHGVDFKGYKDQVIFEAHDVLKSDGQPYTIFTPYMKKWLERYNDVEIKDSALRFGQFIRGARRIIPLNQLGFEESRIEIKPYRFHGLEDYHNVRDYPELDQTSHLSVHLRFGTVSVRECVQNAMNINETFLSELIWREFFMQILYHFPHVVTHNFKAKYDAIEWRNEKGDFEAWCQGKTGYPFVDAGMRELNETGYMHNRVRMVTASFLVKHLLLDWRRGEKYFAEKLLDYDLSANNGNWQWAAGTGCDAAPYFRIFNPTAQMKKFDSHMHYTRKWVKDLDEKSYPQPIVDHRFARERCLNVYKAALG